MSIFGKTATVRFVRLAYLDFSYIFPIETTNEPFGLKNINKPVRAPRTIKHATRSTLPSPRWHRDKFYQMLNVPTFGKEGGKVCSSGRALIHRHVGLVDNSVWSHYTYPPDTPGAPGAPGNPNGSQRQYVVMK